MSVNHNTQTVKSSQSRPKYVWNKIENSNSSSSSTFDCPAQVDCSTDHGMITPRRNQATVVLMSFHTAIATSVPLFCYFGKEEVNSYLYRLAELYERIFTWLIIRLNFLARRANRRRCFHPTVSRSSFCCAYNDRVIGSSLKRVDVGSALISPFSNSIRTLY